MTPEFAMAAHEVSEEAEEQVSLSETIEHVQSSSEEDLEVLEASAEVAAATRHEFLETPRDGPDGCPARADE